MVRFLRKNSDLEKSSCWSPAIAAQFCRIRVLSKKRSRAKEIRFGASAVRSRGVRRNFLLPYKTAISSSTWLVVDGSHWRPSSPLDITETLGAKLALNSRSFQFVKLPTTEGWKRGFGKGRKIGSETVRIETRKNTTSTNPTFPHHPLSLFQPLIKHSYIYIRFVIYV